MYVKVMFEIQGFNRCVWEEWQFWLQW